MYGSSDCYMFYNMTEDFVTPSSTPPNEPTEPVAMDTDQPPPISDIFSEDLSEAVLREKIYDK